MQSKGAEVGKAHKKWPSGAFIRVFYEKTRFLLLYQKKNDSP
jgi:hypothetical protein